MKRLAFVLGFGVFAATLVAQGPSNAPSPLSHSAAHRPAAVAPRLVNAYGQLPLAFEVNQGQADKRVKFLSRGKGYALFLTATEAVLSLEGEQRKNPVRMKLVGANPRAHVHGLEPLPGKSNYFIGNDPKKWHTNIPHYAKVRYAEVYPGIDLIYYGNPEAWGQLEYDFVVAPGAEPKAIRLAFEGPGQLELDAQGNLMLRFPKHDARSTEREVRLRKPLVYQELNRIRQEIPGGYVLLAENQIAFELAAYDRSKALVIDPTLVYATYLGGSGAEDPGRLAVGPDGSVYVVGNSNSSNFPLATPLQGSLAGGFDGFVTKLSPDGSSLLYSTYVGGTNLDEARVVAVDGAGNAYVAGDTESPNFPTTAGAFDTTFNGTPPVRDAFVLKLGVSGSDLLYSTFLGGSGTSFGQFDAVNGRIAVDNTGNAYVAGCTGAPDFPTTEGAFDRTYNGPSFPINCVGDAFVTKLNASGTALVYSTYLGGSGADAGVDIRVDDSGNAYVVVGTGSADFPTTQGAFSSSFKGGATPTSAGTGDTAVVKLNPAGSALIYSTYLGGSGFDSESGIAIDSVGSAYITGTTSSTDFPTANALQPAYGGGPADAFVTKLNPTGSALVYSTYLGGSGAESASDIGVDAGGNAYLTGFTDSTNFPTANALQPGLAGSFDAYLAKLNAAGIALAYSTYLGGSGLDAARGIAVTSAGDAYAIGVTFSTNFPTTTGAFQTTFAGGDRDAFVVKITDVITVAIDIKPGSFPNSINLSSAGNIPVAVLSTADFNAPAEVDPDSLRLAGAAVNLIGKSGRFQCGSQDVNGDGLLDLVCHFETAQFFIEVGESMAVLEGQTFGGQLIRGQDSVRIVPDQ